MRERHQGGDDNHQAACARLNAPHTNLCGMLMIVTAVAEHLRAEDAAVSSALEVRGGITALKGRTVSKLTHFSLFCLSSHV